MRSAVSTPQDWARFRPGALDGITLMNAHFTEHAFERHSHETYSVGLTLSGVQTFHCGGSQHASLRGDIILFNPDEAHDGRRGTREGFGYAMLYVPQQVMDECRDREAGIDAAVHFATPLVRDAEMGRALYRAIGAMGQAQESLRAQELTRTALTRLLQRHGERPAPPGGRAAGSARMNRVRDYLCAHFDEDLTVDALAREAGLSRVHLTRAFARQFGVPPHLYLNAVRIRRAQEAMRSGRPLAEVALACGFADQSHFSRRFKGSVGLSPGAWLRQMQA
ncbi:AraC family transcriptional regulator [Variovorax terrae]|uniref:AraC family transcriptional regulator n=1 Tax=Variovorax terrae TaxID=2923278 RepID=A0A9X1VZW1_9BURK|nr:AraC family transcriptional regulator [Variovorax terrae]MCJ0763523.1 AraC family transcriptional regulator [Variovorax terrae]